MSEILECTWTSMAIALASIVVLPWVIWNNWKMICLFSEIEELLDRLEESNDQEETS